MSALKYKVGTKNTTNQGLEIEIIEYNNCFDFSVKFLHDGYIKKNLKSTNQFKKGEIWHPYFKSIAETGYFGEGQYDSKHISYKAWNGMIDRCYNTNHESYKDYGAIGITVCEEWHNFQNYAKWYENEVKILRENNIEYDIDKDISLENIYIFSRYLLCCSSNT